MTVPQRIADQLAALLPPGWSTRVDATACAVLDPSGRCCRTLFHVQKRADLADVVVELVTRYGAPPQDAAVQFVRRRCPWVPVDQRAR